MRDLSDKVWTAGLACLCVALWILSIWWPIPEPTRKLTVGIGASTSDLGLVWARDSELLPGSQVRMIELTWSSATMRAFGNRLIDMANLSMEEFFRQREEGLDLRIAAIVECSHQMPALVSRGNINDVGQLRGGTVGYPVQASGGFLLGQALKANGVPWAEVKADPLSYSDAPDAFGNLKLDALITVEPWFSQLQETGWRSLWSAEKLETGFWTVVAVRKEVCDKDWKLVEKILQTNSKKLQAVRPDAGDPLMMPLIRHMGLKPERWKQVVGGVSWIGLEESAALLGDSNSAFWRHARDVHDFLRQIDAVSYEWQPNHWLVEGGGK